MRPIDICHPNDLRAPVPMALPARCHGFRRAEVPRTLRLRVTRPGIRAFHDARDRFGGPASNEDLELQGSARRQERGRCLPTTHDADRTSDISVASSSPRTVRLRAPIDDRCARAYLSKIALACIAESAFADSPDMFAFACRPRSRAFARSRSVRKPPRPRRHRSVKNDT